jgi:hypothetical protein
MVMTATPIVSGTADRRLWPGRWSIDFARPGHEPLRGSLNLHSV